MVWVNLLLIVVLVAGHTELLVMLVNRVYALPLGCRVLRWVRQLHDVMIPAFPIVLIWFVGLRGAGLLTGGSWFDLPVGWTVYFTLCAAGAVGLLVSMARWAVRTVPDVQLSNDSWIVDLESRLGDRPVGDGPFRFLTRLPGNEVFRVEVSQKAYRLPRLPLEWDGLSILHLSDFHFIGTIDRAFFEQVVELSAQLRPDLIVFTGDLLDRQRLIEWVPETLGRLTAPWGCYFVLGNHDWYLDSAEIRRHLTDLGWQDVAGKTITVEHKGRAMVIGGTERPWMGAHPDFSASPAEAFRLLLSHTPDHFRWAREQNVDLMLSGHTHGGQIVLPLIGPVYSPSLYGSRYAGGVFWDEPAMLYVSRGISGRHPIRWNCPPELTKLILKCA